MPYKMHPKHYDNVMSFTAKERYLYLVNKVADWEQLWGIYNENEGWLLRTTEDNIEYLSIWPHPEFAKNIAKEYYPESNEEEMSLEFFMSDLLPKLQSDNVKIGVFPAPEGTTWLMEAKDLLEVLEEECEQYE